MKRLAFRTGFYLAVDIALLLACLFHIPYLLNRAKAPFVLVNEEAQLHVDLILEPEASGGLQVGDVFLGWEGAVVPAPEFVDYLADTSSIGNKVSVAFRTGGNVRETTVTLIPFYSRAHIIISLLVGIVTWCVGVFVLLSRQRDPTASVLHWAMVSLGVSVMLTWGAIPPGSLWSYLSRTLHFVSYAAVPATFFLFTTMFPRPKAGSVAMKSSLTFGPTLALLAAMLYYHARAIYLSSADDYISFQKAFDLFRMLLIVYAGAGIFNFVHSYVTAASSEERRKLKWILWGLCVGPTPFLVLSAFPQVVWRRDLVPEEYTLLFLVIIPFAFAISCIRYHLLDIEVVINRSTVYLIVLGGITALYYLAVTLIAALIGATAETLTLPVSVAAAVAVALLFGPVRTRVQRFVDKRFFRVLYNFREAQRKFAEEMKRSLDPVQLAELIVARTDELLALERIGFFTVREPGHRLHLIAHRNYEMLERHGVRFEMEKLQLSLQLPVGRAEKIEAGVLFEPTDAEEFRRWGIALVFTMMSENSEIVGFFVLGEKKSGERFSAEDVDLLNTVTTQAGLAIERITLQMKLMLEHAETQRLEDLNRLKSDFVSYVSHELRTPLTSIKMFAELLKTRSRKLDRKVLGYVRVIEGETDRLNRMVTNILDSARIDRGVKQFVFSDVDIRKVAQDVLKSMKYQLDKHRFRVKLESSKRPLTIHADPDAVAQAFMNLVSNSIKYSLKKKYLKITLSRNSWWVFCRVADRGSGISREVLPHLFEKFYRDPLYSLQVQGVGLGLPLVKHIMEAHGGKVEVNSQVGRGSAFTLYFPLKKRDTQAKQ